MGIACSGKHSAPAVSAAPSPSSSQRKAPSEFGRLDVLVNHADEQHVQQKLEEIGAEQLERTLRTNVFTIFYLAKAALPHMKRNSAIINTSSVTAYKGSPMLIDYASSKGAIVSFTRSLSEALAERGVRVNAVAPGPVWTPLIPSTFPAEKAAKFGMDVPLGSIGDCALLRVPGLRGFLLHHRAGAAPERRDHC